MFYLKDKNKNSLLLFFQKKINLLQQLKANKVQIEMIEFYHIDQHKNLVLVFDMDHKRYNYYLNHHIFPKINL